MNTKAFQECYPDHFSHCYGCGRLNDEGLHIKSYWALEGEETICTYTPEPRYTAIPGLVYGGMLASMIDCHSTGSAAAFAYHAEGRAMAGEPSIRFLTASLHVDYLKPTPQNVPLVLRSRLKEIKGRKVVVITDLWAGDVVTVKGELVAVRVPDQLEQTARTLNK